MRLLIAAPFLIVLALFALSNRQSVSLGFWPTDFNLVAPLSLAILVVAAVAFLFGGCIVWISELGQRRRARRAEARLRRLEEEVQALQARSAVRSEPALPPPAV
jgi:putative membrane protein